MKQPGILALKLRRCCTIAVVSLFVVQACVYPSEASESPPQIMLNPDRLTALLNAAESDDEAAHPLRSLRKKAEEILEESLLSHTFEVTYHGKPATMLKTSRTMLKRASILGLAWNLWKDERYAARGRAELLGVAAFKHWNPAHFLDVAEMAAAVSIGLSWFASRLSEEDVAVLVDALVEKAIVPGLALYESAGSTANGASWIKPGDRGFHPNSAAERADHGWPIESFNWNIVCNSGLALAGLMVRTHKPNLSRRLFSHIQRSIKHGFAEFEPHGGFSEGLGYWSYASRYAALFLDSVPDIMGEDFDYSTSPGFDVTGDFLLHLTGPTGLAFNFGDSAVDPNRVAMAWLGKRFNRPVDLWFDHGAPPGSRLAFDLLWRQNDRGKNPISLQLSAGRHFKAVHIAAFRSDWTDKKALFASLKGGDNQGHHTHLDLGSFVLEGSGVRWAVELGKGNYLLPGYFGRQRWDYYRTATIGQNTLTFGDDNQALRAIAPLSAFHQTPNLSFAIADLGAAYGLEPAEIRRRLAMLERRLFVIQDEISGHKPEPVTWGMHTHATVELDPQQPQALVLRQDGQALGARIISPAGSHFEIQSARREPPERTNKGVTKIVINIAGVMKGVSRSIIVVLEPGVSRPPAPVQIVPLANWTTLSSSPTAVIDGTVE